MNAIAFSKPGSEHIEEDRKKKGELKYYDMRQR
jgi:hypothetical protein